MLQYAIRLSILLALVTPLPLHLMPGMRQMNPVPDWIFYWNDATANLHDLERHISTPLRGIPYDFMIDFNMRGELAYMVFEEPEIWIFDVRSSVNNPRVIYTRSTSFVSSRLRWSPDGRYLAFMMEPSIAEPNYLYIWSDKTVIEITPLGPDTLINAFEWGQDSRMAFTVLLPGIKEGQIWPADLYLWDGQQTIKLTETPDLNERIGPWNREGHLAYSSQGMNPDDPHTVMIWDGVNSIPTFPRFFSVEWMQWNAENELIVSGLQQPTDTWLQLYRWDGEQFINISPDSHQSYNLQTWSNDGRWAVGVIRQPDQGVESIQVRDVNNQLLLDVPGSFFPVWTEAGNLLFCQKRPQGWALVQWDGEQIRSVAEGISIYTVLPNGRALQCI
jgi:hypothetical protein